MRKKLTWIVIFLTSFITLIFGAFTHYLYKLTISSKGKREIADLSMREIQPNDPWEIEKRWFQDVDKHKYSLTTQDHHTLSSDFISHPGSNKLVIVAHGYGQNNQDMSPWVKLFYDLGYNILLPDARGHGESTGKYIGFGWHERHDYLEWIDKMNVELNNPTIVLFGLSMGGATVVNVSGEKLPDNVVAIIEDCGYSSLTKELEFQFKKRYNLPTYPLLNLTSAYTKLRAGYTFDEVAPYKQITMNNLPILIIHGDKDGIVPVDMAYELYEAANEPKELYIVKGARHGFAYIKNKKAYREKISNFLNAHTSFHV